MKVHGRFALLFSMLCFCIVPAMPAWGTDPTPTTEGLTWRILAARGVQNASDTTALEADPATGAVLIGGDFPSVQGVAVDGLARYANGVWSRVGNPTYAGQSSIPRQIAVLPTTGSLAHVGFLRTEFVYALSIWRDGTWRRVAAPATAGCNGSAAFDRTTGSIYAACDRQVYVYRNDTWSPFGPALAGPVDLLSFDAVNQRVIAAVPRSGAGPTAFPRRVDLFALSGSGPSTLLGTASTFVSQGTGQIIESIDSDPSTGNLAIGGFFSEVSGVAANNVAILSGGRWQGLSSGANGAVYDISWSRQGGALAVSGLFTEIGGLPLPGFGIWATGRWRPESRLSSGWVGAVAPSPLGNGFTVAGDFVINTSLSGSVALVDVTDGASTAPVASIGDTLIVEGTSAGTDLALRVTLDRPAPGGGASIRWATQDGSAKAGEDFVAASGLLQLAPGATASDVSVRILGDTAPEDEESFVIQLSDGQGVTIGRAAARVTITDDDRPLSEGVIARPDVFRVSRFDSGYLLDVLGNDIVDRASLRGGTLSIVRMPEYGRVSVASLVPADDDAGNDRVSLVVPGAPARGPVVFRYRLCRSGGACSEADVHVDVGPLSPLSGEFPEARAFGSRAIEYVEMPAVTDGLFEAYGMVPRVTRRIDVPADPIGRGPWLTGSSQPTFVALRATASNRRWRTLVSPRHVSGSTTVDLHLGIDRNGDRVAQPEERLCSTVVATDQASHPPRCGVEVTANEAGDAVYWFLLHGREGARSVVDIDAFDVPLDAPSPARTLRATGASVHRASAAAPVMMSWDSRHVLPGQVMGGWVRFRSSQAGVDVWDAIHFRPNVESTDVHAIVPGSEASHALSADGRSRLFVIDVPPGQGQMTVALTGEGPVQARLRKTPALASLPEAPLIPAPPASALVVASAASVAGAASLRVRNPQEGRYWLEVLNTGVEPFTARILATLEGAGRSEFAGGFFNPMRSGHGLFVYPAGTDLAGLWYTYDTDGQPTWYYLQGQIPANAGPWHATLYRSVWLESRNQLTAVGRAIATPTSDRGAVFSFEVDGRAGSERLAPFGGSCPQIAGRVVDASGHWFDPRRSGTGYSSQFFSNYEFHAVFRYDATGMPRFLVAEGGLPLSAERTLTLEQLTGFCPWCTREGAPSRRAIGTLRRAIADGALSTMGPEYVLAAPLAGAANVLDDVQSLGTNQGCP